MPEFDSTITISIVLAICALFAPSITALINNRHQYKIRKLELHHDQLVKINETQYANKFNTYMAFTKAAGQYAVHTSSSSHYSELLTCIQAAILICDQPALPLLLNFNKLVNKKAQLDVVQYLDELTALSKVLNEELEALSVDEDVNSK